MAILKGGTARLNPRSLVLFTRRIINKMTGNADFSTPQPTLVDMEAKLTEFENMATAAIDGSKAQVYSRNESSKELKTMLRTLANYVSLTADGDGVVILSSGFDVRSDPEPAPPLTNPQDLKASRSSRSGEVDLDWTTVSNALNYQVEFSTIDPIMPAVEWVQSGVSSKSKYSVDNLTVGQFYWFRVKAYGRDDASGYSDPALVMAA